MSAVARRTRNRAAHNVFGHSPLKRERTTYAKPGGSFLLVDLAVNAGARRAIEQCIFELFYSGPDPDVAEPMMPLRVIWPAAAMTHQ